MSPNHTPGSGRRKRAGHEDDLASSPAQSPSTEAVNAKRRRVAGLDDSPRSTPKGFSALSSAIGGALNRTAQRNGTRRGLFDERDDKPDHTMAESSYDILESDDGGSEGFLSKPKKLDFGRRPKQSRSTKSLYDVPDSGDELVPEGGAKSQEEEEEGGDQVTHSKRKSVNGHAKGALPRSTTRKRDGQEPGEPVNKKTDVVTPRRRGRPPKAKAVEPEPESKPETETVFPLAVKARVYGPAGKNASGLAPEPPRLKGILTPRKRKAGRPVKSVVFESNEVDSEMLDVDVTPRPVLVPSGHKTRSEGAENFDIPMDTEKAKGKKQNNERSKESDDEQEQDEVDDDDEVCTICSKPDSEPPNEIIFCEVCDAGFHQKCYNVPIIPEGDWICRNCSQDDVLPEGPDRTESKAVTSTEIPDIPNFEQHFQKTRRVLLDRCSGNRKIKLRGQSEAYDKAYQLVEQTVLAGEGNSMMVIGGRGCGKTTVGPFSVAFLYDD